MVKLLRLLHHGKAYNLIFPNIYRNILIEELKTVCDKIEKIGNIHRYLAGLSHKPTNSPVLTAQAVALIFFVNMIIYCEKSIFISIILVYTSSAVIQYIE